MVYLNIVLSLFLCLREMENSKIVFLTYFQYSIGLNMILIFPSGMLFFLPVLEFMFVCHLIFTFSSLFLRSVLD